MVHSDRYHIVNLIILICKQLIYRGKCRGFKPTMKDFVQEIKLNNRIELSNVLMVSSSMLCKIRKKWSPIQFSIV